ncbi:hypothetical protein C477_21205 [Haloterrigena salina JCM 13891]|uniref:Uncharacterized protein n=1 Tax=Haloterrigena salina JCM 13891 TaxID=1227488 RepID=M0BWQ3_9EURY|nr:hypothetical protein C477_21205 [Haloterrigena salina JCM 13891]
MSSGIDIFADGVIFSSVFGIDNVLTVLGLIFVSEILWIERNIFACEIAGDNCTVLKRGCGMCNWIIDGDRCVLFCVSYFKQIGCINIRTLNKLLLVSVLSEEIKDAMFAWIAPTEK